MKKNPNRVCVVRHGYFPSDPRVYKEVRAMVEAGMEVDVICLRNQKQPLREIVDGVRVVRLPHSHRRGSTLRYMFEYGVSMLLMSLVLSVRFLWRRYSLIQVNTLPDSLVFTTLLPRLFGVRVLLDMHEPSPELLLTKRPGQVSDRMLRMQIFFEKKAIAYADRVLTVNDTIRQRFIERGAAAEKLEVVRNVPADEFGRNVSAPEPHDGLVLLTHGTLQPRYGQEVILHALPRIRKAFDSVQLIIAGDGETKCDLEQLAVDLGCDDITTFTGFLSREEMAEQIVRADIGIVPLLPGPFAELCQPNKLFEYVALNTAVVASRLPAMEESFDEHCIRFFEAGDASSLADAVIELGREPALREALAGRASEVYEALRWSRAGKEYVRIVQSLIGNKDHADA
jgi:glycosyltransferase involved in cell wall biosynthesis